MFRSLHNARIAEMREDFTGNHLQDFRKREHDCFLGILGEAQRS
jgi:hypothetical protein